MHGKRVVREIGLPIPDDREQLHTEEMHGVCGGGCSRDKQCGNEEFLCDVGWGDSVQDGGTGVGDDQCGGVQGLGCVGVRRLWQ